uniref:ATP synthase complex subunit 8 n=1 Tax=Nannochorista philpotti TaxID=1260225 RepID=E9NQ75_9NEOP|nr:ATP synthase F0 subunit 8 [Nannochorista philpotti]
MPQMAPISWLSLFIMFSIIFMMFNIMIYFLSQPNVPLSTKSNMINTPSLNWKW